MNLQERLNTDAAVLAGLGIEFVESGDGAVVLRLAVTGARVNAQGFCHGGYLFALADTACAYVLGDSGMAPATVDANISYLEAARAGDAVRATASAVRAGRRRGVAEVRLTRERDGALLAVYRGTCVDVGASARRR